MVGEEVVKDEEKKGKLGIEVSNTYVLLLFSIVMRQNCSGRKFGRARKLYMASRDCVYTLYVCTYSVDRQGVRRTDRERDFVEASK
jgi:hypothetical protein